MSRLQRNTVANKNHSDLDKKAKTLLKGYLNEGKGDEYLNKVRGIADEKNSNIALIINTPIGPRGHTALHYAVKKGDFKLAELLLEQGAEVNATLSDGNTPLHLAAKKIPLLRQREDKFSEIYSLLLENGANENKENTKQKTPKQLTPKQPKLEDDNLKLAQEVMSEEDKKETLVKTLVEHKDDLRWHWDVKINNIVYEITDRILDQRGENHDASGELSQEMTNAMRTVITNTHLDDEGNTALHFLAKYTAPDISFMEELIKEGANVNQTNNTGYTALHCAAERGNDSVVKLLWKYMADVNAKTDNGDTPLDLAAENNHQTTCDFLIGQGAVANSQSTNREAPEQRLPASGISTAPTQDELQPTNASNGIDHENEDDFVMVENPNSTRSHPAPHVEESTRKVGFFSKREKVEKQVKEEYTLDRENKESNFFDYNL